MRKITITGIVTLIILTVVLVYADDNIYCTGIHTLTCPIGPIQDNITLFNVSTNGETNLTTSQNSLGLWNVTYVFNTEGKYCAKCDYTNQSRCFDVVDYCQENIDTNIDAIQTDIGDPSGAGTTLYALMNSIYAWIQSYLVNPVGVHVG